MPWPWTTAATAISTAPACLKRSATRESRSGIRSRKSFEHAVVSHAGDGIHVWLTPSQDRQLLEFDPEQQQTLKALGYL